MNAVSQTLSIDHTNCYKFPSCGQRKRLQKRYNALNSTQNNPYKKEKIQWHHQISLSVSYDWVKKLGHNKFHVKHYSVL